MYVPGIGYHGSWYAYQQIFRFSRKLNVNLMVLEYDVYVHMYYHGTRVRTWYVHVYVLYHWYHGTKLVPWYLVRTSQVRTILVLLASTMVVRTYVRYT